MNRKIDWIMSDDRFWIGLIAGGAFSFFTFVIIAFLA